MFNNDVYQLYGCDQEPKNLGVRSKVSFAVALYQEVPYDSNVPNFGDFKVFCSKKWTNIPCYSKGVVSCFPILSFFFLWGGNA